MIPDRAGGQKVDSEMLARKSWHTKVGSQCAAVRIVSYEIDPFMDRGQPGQLFETRFPNAKNLRWCYRARAVFSKHLM